MKQTKITLALKFAIGCLMILAGIYAIVCNYAFVQSVSKVIGIIAIAAGAVTITASLMSQNTKATSIVRGIITLVVGILFCNTHILTSIGKVIFIIIGAVLFYFGIELIAKAFIKSGEDNLMAAKIVAGIIIVVFGVWVILKARYIFTTISGIVAGIFFIAGGIGSILDFINESKYNKNFGFLDN